jgi:hypothetical protein
MAEQNFLLNPLPLPKLEEKLEEKLEDNLEDKLEEKLEDNLEDNLADNLADNLEETLEMKAEEVFRAFQAELAVNHRLLAVITSALIVAFIVTLSAALIATFTLLAVLYRHH